MQSIQLAGTLVAVLLILEMCRCDNHLFGPQFYGNPNLIRLKNPLNSALNMFVLNLYRKHFYFSKTLSTEFRV